MNAPFLVKNISLFVINNPHPITSFSSNFGPKSSPNSWLEFSLALWRILPLAWNPYEPFLLPKILSFFWSEEQNPIIMFLFKINVLKF